MKIPKTPPRTNPLWDLDRGRANAILQRVDSPLVNGKYLHWDELQNRRPPTGLTLKEWWLGLKYRRSATAKKIPLTDKSGNGFQYLLVDPIPEQMHQIDLGAGGSVQMPDQVTNPETRDQYYVSSLIDEAITSSQVEGATTTRKIAREMIRTGRPPADRSERMILNNYLAMRKIGSLRKDKLTRELVFEIHRIITDNALDDPSAAGRFRSDAERIRVEGLDGQVFHEPPPAESLRSRMTLMCEFANAKTGEFIHPVIRSILLHFWLSYDHPFVDGNGRTARALFYWSMLHHNYWLAEFISISQVIRKSPVGYGRAFLFTETDDNDLTYFILYHLRAIRLAIDELHHYITKKTRELRSVEAKLRGMDALNHRQRVLIGHALRHPGQRYTIESHRLSQNVVYQTARTDLMDLMSRGLLNGSKAGKGYVFTPAHDLETRLMTLG